MARIKRGKTKRRRHKKILKLAKGYRGAKSSHFKAAKEQVMHSLMYAYRDRRQKKRNFRSLWITRIGAQAKAYGLSYNKFINGLKQANIILNRKILADIAITDKGAFKRLVEIAKVGRNNIEIKSQ